MIRMLESYHAPKLGANHNRSRMKKGSITKLKLSPKKPPKTDWRAFEAMSEEERHQAALSDPDSPPATDAQLARARRIPTVRALRQKLKLTQEEFAARRKLIEQVVAEPGLEGLDLGFGDWHVFGPIILHAWSMSWDRPAPARQKGTIPAESCSRQSFDKRFVKIA
jgi:hypothetical protein